MRLFFAACLLAALSLAGPRAALAAAPDLERATVSELQAQMAAGQLTSVQLTRAYIDRIAAVNARGPGLNAVRLTNPRALSDASLLDLERATGRVRGPLHGIPVLVKDNLDVAGLPTTAGSVALEASTPDRDSTVVAKLRAAGAVILGKTNLTEFANFMTNGMANGYSSLGGQVLNPYDLDAGTSGSSSGSGSAAAAGLAAITIGTETSGSIVSPSAQQGIVGLRPTVGLVSRAGILPISATQDTAGPMTRTVADAAAELQAIAGKDPEDPATDGAPATVPDYTAALRTDALQGKRIGVVSSTNAQYLAAVAAVQALGATTVQITAPSAPGAGDILTPEFKRDLNAYLARLPQDAPMKSLADIIAYNTAHADEALKFGQTQLTASQATDLSDPAQHAAYATARDTGRASARAAIDTALTTDSLDAILTPSGTLTGLGARAGYPQIVVPAGYGANDRRPVGVAFNGTAYSEEKLLAFAYAYEQAAKLRRTPSEINPAAWRCYAGAPRSCPPGRELINGTELPFSLETASVQQLQARMTAGTLDAVTLTKAYLNRIGHANTEGPSINAVRAINPQALADAARLDAERAAGNVRGPLHGIPVLVKDNLDAAGMPTTAGSVALERSVPAKDSPVVAKLRAAGAVIVGKTNLTEFANFMTNGMANGYSSLGGQVLNPYDLDAGTSGSSSGSGSAAAAGLAAVTIGTETSGSIVSPSAQQGIVGLRPTIGLVSRAGILPISATQDTAGPMTRTVADAAAELQAIAGKDPEDPATDTAPATVPDYLAALSTTALAGKRIGVVNSTNAQYVAAVAAVQALGATTVQIATPSAPGAGDILTPEFKRDLNAYLSRLPANAPMKSLGDVIAFNTAHAGEALKFGQTQLVASQATDLTDPAQNAAYQTARDTGRAAARNAIDTALSTSSLDAILTPSGTLTVLGARAGYPQIVVPAGYGANDRRPVGIAFNGTAYSEEKLLAFAYAYEQATKLRRTPTEINPAVWRCYAGAPRSCPPGKEVATGVRLDFPIETATVAELQAKLTAGTLNAVTLTKAYMQRIADTNTEGPSINAVRALNPKALEEAAKADAERAAGTVRGPLHGIPVLVKDNLDVAGMPTTAGSVALERSVPDRDSPVVAKLRAAGAVLLGKLNLSEFANFLTNGMPSGYSSLGGQVLNPYNADITPSGSSSGSGAAAAAGLAAITIGTETSGSIVSPAAAQGIVGLRPTIGLVSRTGILPISATQDTAGPMTRTVADAAAELGAIAGKDPEDPATDSAPATVPDYLAGLKPDALAGKRIGVISSTNAQYLAAIAAVQALGATTVQITSPQSSAPFDILTPEFKRDLNAYLARLPQNAPMKTLADIIAYNTANANDATKFGQTQLLASQATDLTDPAQNAAYVTARDTQRANAQLAIDNGLTRGTPDPADDVEAIMTPSGTLTGLGARAGYPQLVVPAGYSAGSRDPVGIAFNGTAYSEAKLLAFGYAYEQATKLRKPPSETNPSLWRCVAGNAYEVATRACAPSTPANADVVSTPVGGTVGATLSLTLGAPATFGAFQPGVAREYTATTTANVISTAGDAALTVTDPSSNHPGHLVNGTFFLPQPLQGLGTVKTYGAPVSNDAVTVTFKQAIGAGDALRTGTYAKTLTFTLSTTTP